MLPANDLVLAQVANVGDSRLAARLHHHPPHVGPEKTLVRRVRVEIRVCVPVVRAVSPRPPLDGPFDGPGATKGKEILEWEGGGIRAVGPKTVVAGSDTCNYAQASVTLLTLSQQ